MHELFIILVSGFGRKPTAVRRSYKKYGVINNVVAMFVEESSHTCAQCDHFSTTQQDLINHFKERHAESYGVYTCVKCHKEFKVHQLEFESHCQVSLSVCLSLDSIHLKWMPSTATVYFFWKCKILYEYWTFQAFQVIYSATVHVTYILDHTPYRVLVVRPSGSLSSLALEQNPC